MSADDERALANEVAELTSRLEGVERRLARLESRRGDSEVAVSSESRCWRRRLYSGAISPTPGPSFHSTRVASKVLPQLPQAQEDSVAAFFRKPLDFERLRAALSPHLAGL